MILVTGASGMLGTHLVKTLATENEPNSILALYNSREPSNQIEGVRYRRCDLLDVVELEECMKGITHVYHCAAKVSFSKKDKKTLKKFNVAITANVVNASLYAGVVKLIHISSVAAVGQPEQLGAVANEQTEWHRGGRHSMYAYSKRAAELEVWRGMAEGLPAAIICPPIILGSGDWETGSAHLMQVVADEFSWYTKGSTAWIDVRDVAKAAIILMKSSVINARFIISAGQYSFKEVFTRMANALGVMPPHRYASKRITSLVWRFAAAKAFLFGRHSSLTRETASAAHAHAQYSATAFAEAFPNFEYTNFQKTILDMANEYRKDHPDFTPES